MIWLNFNKRGSPAWKRALYLALFVVLNATTIVLSVSLAFLLMNGLRDTLEIVLFAAGGVAALVVIGLISTFLHRSPDLEATLQCEERVHGGRCALPAEELEVLYAEDAVKYTRCHKHMPFKLAEGMKRKGAYKMVPATPKDQDPA